MPPDYKMPFRSSFFRRVSAPPAPPAPPAPSAPLYGLLGSTFRERFVKTEDDFNEKKGRKKK